MAKGKPPAPIVRLEQRGLVPVTAFDAERINGLSTGTEFDLVKRGKRSIKHMGTYWAALDRVVKATGKWPTKEHLHDDLVYSCGFVRWGLDLKTMEPRKTRDSISFDAMNQEEFNEYFNAAMKMLAGAIGYDPLRFMDAA